jgi:hypothetical protein
MEKRISHLALPHKKKNQAKNPRHWRSALVLA